MSRVSYIKPHETPDFGLFNDCLVRIRERRRLIYIFTIAAFAISITFVLITPYTYTATAKVMPSLNDSRGTSVSSMFPAGAIFSRTADQINLYLELLKSNQVKDSVLAQYGYNPSWNRQERPPVVLSHINDKVVGKAILKTTFSGDYKSSVVTISTSASDPELSAHVANAFVDCLDFRLQELDKSRAAKVGSYLARQVVEQREKLREIEEKSAKFLAQNRNYATGDDPELRLEMERLEMDVEFHRELLLTLLQLKANNDLEVQKSISRLVVIEWAKPPEARSPLSRLKTIILVTVGSGLFAVGLIVLRRTYQWYIPQDTRSELAQSCASVSQDARAVANRIRRPFRVLERPGV